MFSADKIRYSVLHAVWCIIAQSLMKDNNIIVVICNQQEDEEQCSDGKRHVCPQPDCNVVCSKASKLKLHMLVHTVERPFKVFKVFYYEICKIFICESQ